MADINEYIFIKNIESTVAGKLEELELSVKKPLGLKKLKSDNRRFYVTPGKIGKKQVFFKMLIVNGEWPAYTLKKEAQITKFFSQITYNKNKLHIPLFVDGDIENQPYWFCHEFLPGPLVGYFYEMNKQGQINKSIKQIIDNLVALHSVSIYRHKKTLNDINLAERDFERQLKEINIRKAYLKGEKNIPFEKIKKFVQERERHFKAFKPVLCHGDYTLANFFIHKNQVYTTDWEHIHFDNMATDLVHMWAQTWRYPKWRKKAVEYYISQLPKNKTESFQELFRAMALIEALGEMAFSAKICKKQYKTGAIKAARATVESAFASFNNLTNLCLKN